MKTVFDIGVFDGEDSAYYLELGYRVIGVEASPVRAAQLRGRFAGPISAGRFHLVEAAVAEQAGVMQLHMCEKDGGNSLLREMAGDDWSGETVDVPTVTIESLIGNYGVPYLLKVDIEGVDRAAILPLTSDIAPQYVSFEAWGDALELLGHLQGIGYARFKIVNQQTHREMARNDLPSDRVRRKLRRVLGLGAPKYVTRMGRRFRTTGCSGPAPEWSDGSWHDYRTVVSMWESHVKNPLGGWWDIHAGLP